MYLVLEKLRTVIMRNLIKRIHLLAPPPKHQLKLPMVASTMQALGQSSAASGTTGIAAGSARDASENHLKLHKFRSDYHFARGLLDGRAGGSVGWVWDGRPSSAALVGLFILI